MQTKTEVTTTIRFDLRDKRGDTVDSFETEASAVNERNLYPLMDRVRVVRVTTTEEVVA